MENPRLVRSPRTGVHADRQWSELVQRIHEVLLAVERHKRGNPLLRGAVRSGIFVTKKFLERQGCTRCKSRTAPTAAGGHLLLAQNEKLASSDGVSRLDLSLLSEQTVSADW